MSPFLSKAPASSGFAPRRARAAATCALVLVTAALLAPVATQAADLYAKVGAPGLMLGISQRLTDRVTLRTDFSTIGSIKRDAAEQGIDYKGALKANRIGVFGDWFMTGGFRLTGGLTLNDMSMRLKAQGNGQGITIGSTTVQTDSSDQLNVDVRFPRVTPYLGIGYGHHSSDGSGFLFDLGASIGRPKVSETHVGTHFSQLNQADIDQELAELRSGVGKLRFVPQVTVGFSGRF